MMKIQNRSVKQRVDEGEKKNENERGRKKRSRREGEKKKEIENIFLTEEEKEI